MIKNVTHVNTSVFALKTNLTSLKTEVDKLDFDKLVPVPVDLSKLIDIVKNDAVKKDEYDKLVATVNNIDTSNFVLKTKYQTDKTELENKIPHTKGLVKKTDCNTKIAEIEGKIPDISNLAIKAALTAAENKMPYVCSLVKRANYKIKITEIEKKLTDHIHDKYITTSEFNTLAADIFNARLAQDNLITKTDFDAKLSRINRKITENKTKNLLVENESNKLKTFDLNYFTGKSHFEEDGTQNYLEFQPLNKYFKVISNTVYASSWKSKGLSAESIKPPTTSDNSLTVALSYYGTRTRVKFTGSCLKEPRILYTYGKVVKIYIAYELGASSSHNNDPTLKHCIFGAVTLTKNADIDKYGHSGYGVGFDRKSTFSFPGGVGFGQNVIIFGVDMIFSAHIDNKKKYISILGKGPTQRL